MRSTTATSPLKAAHQRGSTRVRQAVNLIGRVSVGRLALEAAVCRFFELAPGNIGRVARGEHLGTIVRTPEGGDS